MGLDSPLHGSGNGGDVQNSAVLSEHAFCKSTAAELTLELLLLLLLPSRGRLRVGPGLAHMTVSLQRGRGSCCRTCWAAGERLAWGMPRAWKRQRTLMPLACLAATGTCGCKPPRPISVCAASV